MGCPHGTLEGKELSKQFSGFFSLSDLLSTGQTFGLQQYVQCPQSDLSCGCGEVT